jgi:DNA ligase (NAD+)
MAYKFPAQQIATQVEKIDRQVWRTGVLTPVAHLTPVQLSGVTIARASLHNLDFITTKDIRENDRVNIQRSWEVIPYVVWVIKEKRPLKWKIWDKSYNYPSVCPSCSANTTKKTETWTTQIHCTNKYECPAQIKESLRHFVSKNCMNIDGLWEKYIEILVEKRTYTYTCRYIYLRKSQKKNIIMAMIFYQKSRGAIKKDWRFKKKWTSAPDKWTWTTWYWKKNSKNTSKRDH